MKGTISVPMLKIFEVLFAVLALMILFNVLWTLWMSTSTEDITTRRTSVQRVAAEIQDLKNQQTIDVPVFGDSYKIVLHKKGDECEGSYPCVCEYKENKKGFCENILVKSCEEIEKCKTCKDKVCIINKKVDITHDIAYVHIEAHDKKVSVFEAIG